MRGKYKKVPVNVDEIRIEADASKTKRIDSFLRQAKNPYLMEIDGVTVEMEYADNGWTMQQAVELAVGIDF